MSEYPSYLIHYGIEGQKWGVRRFQNEDGTYTEDGLVRRRKDQKHLVNKQNRIGKQFDKYTEKMKADKAAGKKISNRRINKAIKLGTKHRALDYISKDPDTYFKARNLRAKSIAKFGVNSALTAVGVGKMVGSIGDLNSHTERLNKLKEEFPMRVAYTKAQPPPTKDLQNVLDYFRKNRIGEVDGISKIPDDAPKVVKSFVKRHGNKFLNSNGYVNGTKFYNAMADEFRKRKEDHDIAINNIIRDSIKNENYNEGIHEKAISVASRNLAISSVFTAVNLTRSVAELGIEQYKINKMVKDHYKDSYALAEKATIKDLKKHGFGKEITAAKESRIKSLLSSGKSQAEVADILGISESTVRKYK